MDDASTDTCDLAPLRERVAELTAANAELQARHAELSTTNAELAAQLAWLQKQVFGRRAERFEDPNQQTLFTDGGVESQPPPPPPQPVAGHTRVLGKRGGRMSIDPHLPRTVILHQLPPQDLCDPATGGVIYEAFGFRTTEKIAFTPMKLYVEQHQHVKYRLIDRTRHRLTDTDPPEALTAPPTLQGLDRCLAAPSLLAELLHAKFAMHTPFDRLLNDLHRRTGVTIANATVSNWAQQFAQLATPLVDLMRRRLLAHSTVIQHDDSPVRQLPKKKSGQRRCDTTRFWSAVGERGSPGDYIVINHTQSRAGHHVRNWMGDPNQDKGPRALRFIQCDEYAGYDALFADGTLKRVGCFAHARRKWSDLRDSHPHHAQAALQQIQKLYDVERQLTGLRDGAVNDQADWHQTRRRVRQEQSVPLLNAYFDFCRKTLADLVRPKHPVAAAARYSLNQEDDLRRYADHGQLEIDNNACERSIRPLCIGKKNWLFIGSPDAGRAAATIFTLIAGATRHEKNPHTYLEHLLLNLRALGPTPTDEQLEPLLPDHWTPSTPTPAEPDDRQRVVG